MNSKSKKEIQICPRCGGTHEPDCEACPNCGGKEFRIDFVNDEQFCIKCGLVL